MDEVNPSAAVEVVISDSTEAPPVAILAERAGATGDNAQARLPGDPAAEQQRPASMDAKLAVQTDLLKSSHNLLVDIAGNIARMSDDAVERAMRPVFIDLIHLFDSVQQARMWVNSSVQLPKEALDDRLDVLETELLEILVRRDVQIMEESGTKLDRQRHRAVKKVATANPEDDNRICEIVRAGFAAGERVLRPADVVIGKYDATLEGEGA